MLEFLLSREAQENWGEYGWTDGYPVNRESFRLLREFCFQREEEDSGNFYFTEEQMDALEREIENIHVLPAKMFL